MLPWVTLEGLNSRLCAEYSLDADLRQAEGRLKIVRRQAVQCPACVFDLHFESASPCPLRDLDSQHLFQGVGALPSPAVYSRVGGESSKIARYAAYVTQYLRTVSALGYKSNEGGGFLDHSLDQRI